VNFEQSRLRGFIHQILTNNLVYAGIFVYSISLIFGDESKVNKGKFFLLAYLGFVFLVAIWIFIFNRSPKIPTYKLRFDEEGLEINTLLSTKKLKWNAIKSFEIANWPPRLTLKDESNTKITQIGYFAFNKEQRFEIIKHLRVQCG
jgi:cbb3-type cytochrome oxidase subunit 3